MDSYFGRLRGLAALGENRDNQNEPRAGQERASRRRQLAGAAALALALLLFAWPLYRGLGDFDLENDEAIYSHAVLSIVRADAWGSPWSSPFTGPFLEKPPLKMWLVALGIIAGLPEDELGLRFFDPLLGALALLYVFAIGKKAGGPLAGLGAAAALFLFPPLLFTHGLRSNNMEAALLLAYCGGAWHLLAWHEAPPGSRRSRLELLAATLFFAFGFLVKFVAALFLPFSAGAVLLLHEPSRRRLFREPGLLAAAAGLFLLLAAPWFVYQHFVHGELFWRVILGQHVVERFTHHLDPTHLHPFLYYFATIAGELQAAGTLPWVLAGLVLWLAAARRRPSFLGLFILSWAFLPLLAISFGTSKLLHYAYPFLPPFALFAGFALSRAALAIAELWRGPGRPRAAAALAAFLALGSLLLLVRPAAAYREILAETGRGPHLLRDLAACLGSGHARTLVDGGQSRPLVFVHAFLTDGIFHPLAFYSRQGSELQQLTKPDEKLLFFRLYLPPHQAATVIPDLLWESFRANLQDPAFREGLLAQARGLGAEAEVAALLAEPAGLPEPPGFRVAGQRYFLPGAYAACLP